MRCVLWLAIGLAFGCRRDDDHGRQGAPASNPSAAARARADTPRDEPAPVVDDEGALVMRATRGRGDAYELHLARGRVLLSLEGGTLVAPDPDRGGAALEVLCRWLEVPVPPRTHTQPLEPLAFESIALGRGEHKVFFGRGGEYAEMYINVVDAEHVAFLPKDPEYGPALAGMFADALRDGPAPARTTQTDPSLESSEPRFRVGVALDITQPSQVACIAGGWLATVATDERTAVRAAAWGDTTSTHVCDLPGAADQIATGVRSPIAVVGVTARDPDSGVISTDDRATLFSVGRSGCREVAMPSDVELGPFTMPFLSPSGDSVAIDHIGALIIVPTAGGKATRSSLEALDLIHAWDPDGIELVDLEGRHRRVRPGETPKAVEHPTMVAPDGLYAVRIVDGALQIEERGTKAMRSFTPSFRSDIRAVERLVYERPRWAGPHALVLSGSPDLALDLATLRTRILTEPGVTAVCIGDDGTHALLAKSDELFGSS